MNKQAQGEFVHPVALGEGERLANKAAEALTQSVVPPLDVAGFAFAFAAQSGGCGRGKTSS